MLETAFAIVRRMIDPRPCDTLGERLKIAFDDSQTKVSEIANACEISVQAVYNWLSGATGELDGQNLARVADLTGFDPMWLEFGSGPRIRTYAKTDRDVTILKCMEQLTDQQAAAVEQMVRAFVEKSEPNGGQAA